MLFRWIAKRDKSRLIIIIRMLQVLRKNFKPLVQRRIRLIDDIITFPCNIVNRSIPLLLLENRYVPQITLQLVFNNVETYFVVVVKPVKVQAAERINPLFG